MDDPELAEIRARRMAQLRGESGPLSRRLTRASDGAGAGREVASLIIKEATLRQSPSVYMTEAYGYSLSADNDQAGAEERYRQQEEMKNGMLSQILDQSARTRLNTLLVVKPEKGRAVESMLINMAQRGQLPGRLGEKELINILEQVSGGNAQPKCTVKFDRRRAALDSDEDDL